VLKIKQYTIVGNMSSVIEVDADNWEKEVSKADSLVVVDSWHEQCSWCKMLLPIYEEVAEEYKDKTKFTTLNVFVTPENQHIALHLGVMSTPTLTYFCFGRPIVATVGFQTKDRLKRIVEDLLRNQKKCIKKSTELRIV
jgi:thioredoxin 1